MPIDYTQSVIPYNDAVEQGKHLLNLMRANQHELGELAYKLEPKYGDQTLERFATELKIDYGTLKTYRTTYKAWKDEPARPASFSVARALNRHPQKYQTFLDNEDMSVQDAKAKMRELREQRPDYETKGVPQATVDRRRDKALTEIAGFLAEGSELRLTILDLNERMDGDYMEEIVHELHSAGGRIATVLGELGYYPPAEEDDSGEDSIGVDQSGLSAAPESHEGPPSGASSDAG
jgi:hypothetical protein